MSSSAGRFSGLIPLLSKSPLTSLLFLMCSSEIGDSPRISFCLILKLFLRLHIKIYKLMSKSNQIKVISISLIVLNIVFLFVPLEMNWDEVKEEYSPFFIYQNTEILIIHLFCLNAGCTYLKT